MPTTAPRTPRRPLLLAGLALAALPWLVVALARLLSPPELIAAPESDAALPAAMVLLDPAYIALIVIGLGNFIALYLIYRRVARPLDELTRAAAEVGRGNFRPRLPSGGSTDVRKLTESFATMLEALHGAVSQAEASRQMATVGEFASQLSHEIKNPLTSIKLNLQSLEREVRLGNIDPDMERPVRVALREISRLDTVAGSVLRLGRPHSASPPEPRSARELVESAVEVLQLQLSQQRIRVRTEFRAREDTVSVDAEQMTGVFLNLLINAAQVMPNGGAINIRSYGTTETETGAAAVRIHLADEGPGISPEVRKRIFEPFFTTKKEGSGLGLPMAIRTLEDHGGRLFLSEVTDLPGTGAEFVVEIPLVPQLSLLDEIEETDIAPPRAPFVEEEEASSRRRVGERVSAGG